MNSIIQKPWGSYQVLNQEKNHLIKKITVNPLGKLSLQRHEHRSEHWIVVKGIAKITIEQSIKKLKMNESIFIPQKAKHIIEND